MKDIRITFSEEATLAFNHIAKKALMSKNERIMSKAILQKIEWIKADPRYGQPIAKKLIPKEYILKYGAQNLYRVELPDFWRMLYTLRDNQVEIIAFVLDIIDHKGYDKKFRYI